MSSFGTYLVGFIILIIGLGIAAYLLNVPPTWILVGVVVLLVVSLRSDDQERRLALPRALADAVEQLRRHLFFVRACETSQIVTHQRHPTSRHAAQKSPSKNLLTLIVHPCYRAASADQASERSRPSSHQPSAW